MILKRAISILLTTTTLSQSILPAFAMDDMERIDFSRKQRKDLERPKERLKQAPITRIRNISEMAITAGVVVQPGDWVIFDIDDTLLKHGKGTNEDVLNLDPKIVEMVKNWQALNAQELNPHKHITILLLTARKIKNKEKTKEHLKKIDFPENIDIIFAPNEHLLDEKIPTKGKALIKYLKEKTTLNPRRIIAIDDLRENLNDIGNALHGSRYNKIPLRLLQRETHTKIYESSKSEIKFPDQLTNLIYDKHLPGGSGGVHVLKDGKGQFFTFKTAGNSEQMKEEILADALYRSLGVPVPAFAIYDHLPDIAEITDTCLGPGPYRLAPLLEKHETATKDIFVQEIQKHFVVDALLSNFDIVVDDFKNVILDKKGTLWRIDNGGSLRFRARGESKFGSKDWDAFDVTELETMRNAEHNKDGAAVYGNLTDEDLKKQVQEIFENRDHLLNTLDQVAKALHLNNAPEVREMLRRRLDYLAQKYLLAPLDSTHQVMDGFTAPQFGGGILVHSICPNTGQKVILMGKRAGHNWWCNLGGKSDLNIGNDSDQILADTAVREVQEESLGYLSFTAQEVKNTPSHAILNSADVFYRMYMAPHPYIAAEQFQNGKAVDAYGWKPEYSEFRWVLLDQFLLGLEQNNLVVEESKKTIQIGDMILYPYFWEMLQEVPVQNVLTKICKGKKAQAKHTHNGLKKHILLSISVDKEKKKLAETLVNKALVLGEIKAQTTLKALAPKYSFQINLPSNQENVINIFIASGSLWHQTANNKPVKIVSSSNTQDEAGDMTYISGRTWQRNQDGQKFTILSDEIYNNFIGHVKQGTLPSAFEKNELLIASALDAPVEETADNIDKFQEMSGFVTDHAAQNIQETLLTAPYTQTQGYLRHIMGEEVFESLKGLSEKEVNKFLSNHARFNLNPYKIRIQDPNKFLENDELEIFLIGDDLYCKIKNKDDLKIEILKENPQEGLATPGLTQEAYDKLKKAVSENNIALLEEDLKTNLLTYALKVGYTPKLPLDSHYIKVLCQALDGEKNNKSKAVFYHGTDPLTCFLWDIFTAYRSQLKNMGTNALMTLRILEKGFASILDVEDFINAYKNSFGSVSNYDTANNVHYADLGLSVNPFLFGNDGNPTSATYYLFYNTASVSPTKQEQLFNAFLSTVGIPGKFKDYKALFQQYYLCNNRDNSKLFQICIDPQVVDAVSYMAVSGGDVLNVTMDDQSSYHGFAKILPEMRTAPEKFDTRIQDRTSGKINIGRNINNLQGRLFLKPEIFHESKYVTINTWWRHPLPNDFETSFYQKLNAQVSQDLTSWLPQHACLDDQTFVEGIPPLKKLYRYVYEGEMALTYIEKKPQSLLPIAIKNGNIESIREIFEKNPEIDVNERFQSTDYRGYGAAIQSPLAFLTTDTPNFGEIVKILMEKGLKTIEPMRIYGDLQGKLLNEFILYRDMLKEGLLAWFEPLWNREKNKTWGQYDGLADHINKGHINLVSAILNEIEELNVSYIAQENLPLLVNALKSIKTLKRLKIEEDRLLPFINLLIAETEEGYRDAPWFKEAWETIVMEPNKYIQAACYGKCYSLVSAILKNIQIDTIDLGYYPSGKDNKEGLDVLKEGLTSNKYLKNLKMAGDSIDGGWLEEVLKSPHILTLDFGDSYLSHSQTLQNLPEVLKNNNTLERLIMRDEDRLKVIGVLMDQEGTFKQAPWFQEAWNSIISNPEKSLETANSSKRYTLFYTLLKSIPEEILLQKYIRYERDHIPHLVKVLETNEPFKSGCLNLSGVNLWASIDTLAKALSKNTTITSLNLMNCSLSSTEIGVLTEKLKENTTLQKLTLSKKEMFDVMGALIFCEEGAFKNAPWFQEERKGFYASPENIQDAIEKKKWPLVIDLIKNTTIDCLDITKFNVGWREVDLWNQSLMKGLTDNSTLKALTLSDQQLCDIMVTLISSPEGPFTRAPWFCQARAEVLKNPGEYLKQANFKNNHHAILTILREVPEEIELGKFLGCHGDWFKILMTEFSHDGPYTQLNLNGMYLSDDNICDLAKSLKTNIKLKSLELSVGSVYEKKAGILAEGLKTNKTLQTLSFPKKEEMINVIGFLMKDQDAAFREAPWFAPTWKEIIASPEENLKMASDQKHYDLVYKIICDTPVDSLDLTKINHYDKDWLDFAMQGLTVNKTIQTLKVSLDSFNSEKAMQSLQTALRENKTLTRLELYGESRLGNAEAAILIEALKATTPLKEFILPGRRVRLQVLNTLYPYQGHLPQTIEEWVTNSMMHLMSSPLENLKICLQKDYKQPSLDLLSSLILGTLKELKLSWSPCESDALFEGLKTNKTISVLDLDVSIYHYSSPFPDLTNLLKETSGINTLILRQSNISGSQTKDLVAALMENKTFTTLDLSQNSINKESISILGNAIKEGTLLKTIRISIENELALLNELIADKEKLPDVWKEWINPVWKKVCLGSQENFIQSIKSGHQNLAFALLEVSNISCLDVENIYLGDEGRRTLVEILKNDKTIQSLKISDYDHNMFIELFPLKDQVSEGTKAWLEDTWNTIMKNPLESINQALEKYDVNQALVELILNKEGITTLNLSEINDRKIDNLSKILKKNSMLESLSLSGNVYDFSNLFGALTENKNLALKVLDLSQCVCKDKISKYDLKSLIELLKNQKNLTIIILKDALDDKVLGEISNLDLTVKDRLVVRE